MEEPGRLHSTRSQSWTWLSDFIFFLSSIYSNADINSTSTNTPNDDIITSVWVGYDDNTPLKTTEYKYGQNIWFKATEKYEEGKEDIWYETPKNVNLVYVDPISGNLVDENAKVKKGVYFLKGSEPTSVQEVFDEKKDIPHEA